MKFPEKCEHRYKACLNSDTCDSMCNAVENGHPDCKFVSYCDYRDYELARRLCDGRCTYNKRCFDIHKLDTKLTKFWQVIKIIDDTIAELEEEKKGLEDANNRYNEKHRNEKHEYFDFVPDED